MNANDKTLHARLRESTRVLHEDLERAVNIDDQISSRPRYNAYLMRLWSLHRATEDALSSFDFTPFGFEHRTCLRSRLLENDLRDLGVGLRALHDLPHRTPPVLASIEAGLGCIYVVEGSAFGAKAILPQIQRRLGLTAEHGASFFVGFGEPSKYLWRAFLNALNEIDPASLEATRVTEAAEEIFQFFHCWLPERPIEITPPAVART